MKNKRFYIITKTPLRVSLFGGGTDIPSFFNYKKGYVVSTAINKFVYITIKSHDKIFGENYRLNYSTTEHADKISKIQNKIIKACLEKFKINFPMYISTISDLPSNSGLGSSSSFTVGLLKALYELKNVSVTKKKLAIEASKIEIEILKNPIGLQDHLISSYGGFKFFSFSKNYKIDCKVIRTKNLNNILKKSVLIWTSITREASKLLKLQNSRIEANFEKLNQIRLIAVQSHKLFNDKKFDKNKFFNLLIKSWDIKKSLSSKVSNNKINNIFEKLNKFGTIAGKICGAGGGGFLFITYQKKIFFKKNKKI